MRKPKDRPAQWEILAIMTHTRVHNGRRIAVAVTGGGNSWGAVAVELPANAPIAAIFNDHSHHMLGDYPSLADAVASAEGYVAAWQPSGDTCGCGEIEAPEKIDAYARER